MSAATPPGSSRRQSALASSPALDPPVSCRQRAGRFSPPIRVDHQRMASRSERSPDVSPVKGGMFRRRGGRAGKSMPPDECRIPCRSYGA